MVTTRGAGPAAAMVLAGGLLIQATIAPAAPQRAGEALVYEADDPHRPVVRGELLDEGFEGGVFPPAGWSYTPLRPFPHNWHGATTSDEVRAGTSSAAIERQDQFVQDEALFAPPLDLSAASPTDLRLSFWFRTDPIWFQAGDAWFRVHVSPNGTDWTRVFTVEGSTDTGWTWRNAVVDLSPWASETDLRVRLRYFGREGADFSLDDVRVGTIAPPTPPANDDCAGAIAGAFRLGPDVGSFQVDANSFFATHDYGLPLGTSCTGFAHTGRDLVWEVHVPEQHHFVATMDTVGDWDDTLFLISDCGDPAGSCVAGERAFPDGAQVAMPNFGPGTAVYYLVASGWGNEAGEFRLTGGIHPGTSVEPTTWGRIKASYR